MNDTFRMELDPSVTRFQTEGSHSWPNRQLAIRPERSEIWYSPTSPKEITIFQSAVEPATFFSGLQHNLNNLWVTRSSQSWMWFNSTTAPLFSINSALALLCLCKTPLLLLIQLLQNHDKWTIEAKQLLQAHFFTALNVSVCLPEPSNQKGSEIIIKGRSSAGFGDDLSENVTPHLSSFWIEKGMEQQRNVGLGSACSSWWCAMRLQTQVCAVGFIEHEDINDGLAFVVWKCQTKQHSERWYP